jgi:hypothetical protein
VLASSQIRAATARCDDGAVAILPQKGHADAVTDEEIISRFPECLAQLPDEPVLRLVAARPSTAGWTASHDAVVLRADGLRHDRACRLPRKASSEQPRIRRIPGLRAGMLASP